MDITEIDKNFTIAQSINRDDIVYYDPTNEPFRIYGVMIPDEVEDHYRRIPEAVAENINKGTKNLRTYTAGGRIRFRTDSPFVVVHVEYSKRSDFPSMSLCGSLGLDLYADGYDEGERFIGVFTPPKKSEAGYEAIVHTPQSGDRDACRTLTVNMPSYNKVSRIYIGIQRGSSLLPPREYTYKIPVVYYGSSITQGASSSRPGNIYSAVVSRALDCDFVNLGFSGNAFGETTMAEYIAAMKMSVFVMDYDYNAATPAQLEATHEPFFKIIRSAHPHLPIIMSSNPKAHPNEEDIARRDIIRNTYEKALKAGDKNVYFIDGGMTFAEYGGDCATLDNSHPNDLGFVAMANRLIPIVKKCLDNGNV